MNELKKIKAFYTTLNNLKINKYQRLAVVVIKEYEKNLRGE